MTTDARRHEASEGHPGQIEISPAAEADAADLARLAELDSASPLQGPVLIARATGTPLAAISLRDGRAVADPFRRSAEAVELLALRCAHLTAGADRRRSPLGPRRLTRLLAGPARRPA